MHIRVLEFPVDAKEPCVRTVDLPNDNIECITWQHIASANERDKGHEHIYMQVLHNDLTLISNGYNDIKPDEDKLNLQVNQSLQDVHGVNIHVYGTAWIVGGKYDDETGIHTLDHVDKQFSISHIIQSISMWNWNDEPGYNTPLTEKQIMSRLEEIKQFERDSGITIIDDLMREILDDD